MSAKRKLRPGKPLPPYGAAVQDAAHHGRPLNTFVMAGPDAWNRHSNRVDRVVLPPDAAPDDFDWSIFKNQAPTVIADDADPERIKRLLGLLLRAGVSVVACIFLENGITHCRHFRP